MKKLNNYWLFFLLIAFSFLGFKSSSKTKILQKNCIEGQIADPKACIAGFRENFHLTKEQLLEAKCIEVYIPNAEITIKVIRFSLGCDIGYSGYSAQQDSTGAFSEKQIEIINKAPKGTKIYFDDIEANINGKRYFVSPFNVKVK